MNKIISKIVQIFSIPDLRKKIFIVLALLVVFRLFAAVPVPGIDVSRLKSIFSSNQLLGILNIFSGGTMDNLSIVMLGVGPYITASIIMQLLTMIFPRMKEMYYEEGEAGRMKFNQICRYITIPLSLVQAYAYLNILVSQKALSALALPIMIKDIILITAGTMLVMWIGELISEYKIGNGISLIIFAGIISRIPNTIRTAIVSYQPSMLSGYIAFLVVAVVIIAGVVIVNEAERKVPVSYAKRVRGNKMFGGVSTYLPLKVNQAGVIPIIFAISIMLFPQFIGQIIAALKTDWALKVSSFLINLFNNQIIYSALYFILVLLFTYFYTMVTFDPKEISQNLQKNGGFVPGIRPGQPTATFLSQILNRITLVGAYSWV
jgi:preprotein translocase subunit SecY